MRGMIKAHQALRAGGDFEGMSLKRHSSHSPFWSSGSWCFSQIPIGSTIGPSVYHGHAGRLRHHWIDQAAFEARVAEIVDRIAVGFSQADRGCKRVQELVVRDVPRVDVRAGS